MRPSCRNGAITCISLKRSASSQSPAAVGKTSTGVPLSPQRTTLTSLLPRRSERHVEDSFVISSPISDGGLQRAAALQRLGRLCRFGGLRAQDRRAVSYTHLTLP